MANEQIVTSEVEPGGPFDEDQQLPDYLHTCIYAPPQRDRLCMLLLRQSNHPTIEAEQ
jgi:hypothetical protein